jgi:uncharacterized protein YkwD
MGAACAALATVLALAAPAAAPAATRHERAVIAAINEVRAASGVARLALGSSLQAGAHSYARTMINRNLFAHASLPGGISENLAWGSASLMSPRGVVRLWLSSPSHRANLLHPHWRRIGVGLAGGPFQGVSPARVAVARFTG